MKIPMCFRLGGIALAGGSLATVGIAGAVWDNSSALLGIAAFGIVLIVTAFSLSPPRYRRRTVLGGAVVGMLLYPVLTLAWFAWFYAAP